MPSEEKSNEWDSLWQEYSKSLENWKTVFEQIQFSPNIFIVSTLDSLMAFSHTSLNLVCMSVVAFWICSNTVLQFSRDFEYSCQRESHSFDFSSEVTISNNF